MPTRTHREWIEVLGTERRMFLFFCWRIIEIFCGICVGKSRTEGFAQSNEIRYSFATWQTAYTHTKPSPSTYSHTKLKTLTTHFYPITSCINYCDPNMRGNRILFNIAQFLFSCFFVYCFTYYWDKIKRKSSALVDGLSSLAPLHATLTHAPFPTNFE